MNGEYISLETAKKIRRYDILLRRIKILKAENNNLKEALSINHEIENMYLDRINKAIEYIKENKNEGIDDDGYSDAYYDWVYVDELLEILEGDKNE